MMKEEEHSHSREIKLFHPIDWNNLCNEQFISMTSIFILLANLIFSCTREFLSFFFP